MDWNEARANKALNVIRVVPRVASRLHVFAVREWFLHVPAINWIDTVAGYLYLPQLKKREKKSSSIENF